MSMACSWSCNRPTARRVRGHNPIAARTGVGRSCYRSGFSDARRIYGLIDDVVCVVAVGACAVSGYFAETAGLRLRLGGFAIMRLRVSSASVAALRRRDSVRVRMAGCWTAESDPGEPPDRAAVT